MTVSSTRRPPLRRETVLSSAVALADESGLDAVSMRNLAVRLGVVPMAIYNHVASKDQLMSGMVDVIVAQIEPPPAGLGWKLDVRQRMLSARAVMLRHPWAAQLMASRPYATPVVLQYVDSLIGVFRAGGLSVDLTHQVMHTLGSRMWGFHLEVLPSADPSPAPEARGALGGLSAAYPHIAELAASVGPAGSAAGVSWVAGSGAGVSWVAGSGAAGSGAAGVDLGCDAPAEFEFAIDVLLDGFERLHKRARA